MWRTPGPAAAIFARPMPTLSLSRKTALAWVALTLGVLASVLAGLQVKQLLERDAARQFAFDCDQVALKVRGRLDAYALILRGGAGLFAAAGTVERNEWRAYVETLQASRSVPGVQGIGFTQVIPPDELAAHVERIRAEGFPEYSVRPPGPRPLYTSIIYLEPFSDRNLRAFGYDMYSEPVRRAAMEQARDTGEAVLSGKVELVQETGTEVQAGTLMYVPVYRGGAPLDTLEQQRAALLGWAYSPYRMHDLMTGMLGDWEHHHKTVGLRIYDGRTAAPADLLFDSHPTFSPHLDSRFVQERALDFNGRQWLLVCDHSAAAATVSGIGYAPWTTLAGGLTLSGLLFGLMRSVINTRATATRIAAELTAEISQSRDSLRKSHDQVNLLLTNAAEAIFGVDMDGNCTFANNACLRLLGYERPEDLLGKHMHSQIHARRADGTPLPAAECPICQARQSGATVHLEDQVFWHRDGTPVPAECWSAPQGQDGVPGGAVVSLWDLTERRRLERLIARSRNVLMTVIDTVPLGVFWKDHDLRYLGCNIAFAKDAGMTHPRDLIGKDDYQMGWAAQAQRYRADDRAIMASGIAKLSFDEPQTTTDGQTRWIRTSKVPLRNQAGEVFGILGVYEDIADRKQAEEALRMSEELLRVITSRAPDGILMLDHAGNITFWNEAAATIFGYTREEVIGRELHALLVPRFYREAPGSAFPDFRRTGKGAALGRSVELTGRRKDGSEFHLALSLSAARETDAWSAIGIVRDVTELKRMQDALTRGEAEMRTTLYGIADGVISLDSAGRILLMNPVAEALTGWSECEARGNRLDEVWCVVDDKTRAGVADPVTSALRQGGAVALTTNARLIARDGTERPIRGSAAPILDRDRITGVVLVFHDMSKEKALQEQLMLAEKLAVMGRLVGDVSHELNNPLAIVIGRTELLLCNSDGEASSFTDKLEIILHSARRCKTILGGLLGYSGTIGKPTGVVALEALIREAVAAVAQQYDLSGIAVEVDCQVPADSAVPGAEDALLSVFINLIRNARQAMTGPGRLSITVAPEDEDRLRIAIRDTGIGISKEKLATLFQPFRSGWQGGDGTGLGLVTSLGIIETHGGRLWVESDGEGRGAQFTILLPSRTRNDDGEPHHPANPSEQ
jgi:PAS domain S-box-containing protein